jgi:signal transduction histidine kinase
VVKTSRLENGVIKLEPKPGGVYELAETACRQCAALAESKNIRLEYEKNGPGLTALFDGRWCGEALFNIVENAVKYTAPGGAVRLSVVEYEMFARIDVADTGRGIREEDLPKVFGRFWRGAESSDVPGVGIGLYLARKIITDCGGFIKVSSELGHGAVFSVFLSKK